MNWGWGILITIVLFMALTMVRVVYLMNQDVDLVTNNYYEKELKYQQQIDKEKRTEKLKQGVDVRYSGNNVNVTFPKMKDISGDLYFYRPSDFKEDFKVPITVGESYVQTVNVGNLQKGYWRLQINWAGNNEQYYTEKAIMIR